MKYKDLQVYTGEKTGCDECHRLFSKNEIVISARGDLVFCYDESKRGCMSKYLHRTKVWITGGPMRFSDTKIKAPFSQRFILFFSVS